MLELTVEVNIADGWLSPGLALNLHSLPPEAEEEECRGDDEEEAAGGETEGEEAPAGGEAGSEGNQPQPPLLADPPLTGPAGDVAAVLRGGSHCHRLGDGDEVGPGVLGLHQHLNINTSVRAAVRAEPFSHLGVGVKDGGGVDTPGQGRAGPGCGDPTHQLGQVSLSQLD